MAQNVRSDPNTSPYESLRVPFSPRADRHAMLPALSPLPISLMFFSHNKSGTDFLKQTMLWGLSPPITLCQFQSGLKYDSTVCASSCSKYPPPPHFLSFARFPSAILSLGLATPYSSLCSDLIISNCRRPVWFDT